MKNLVLLVIVVILLVSFAFAQEQSKELTNLDQPLTEDIVAEFSGLNGENRNQVMDSTNSDLKKNSVVELMTQEIIKARFEESVASGVAKITAQRVLSKIFSDGFSFYGVDSYDQLKSTANSLGIDFEANLETDPSQFSIRGFENLRFSEEEGNIIGDGTNWINLDDLPLGLNGIEYKNGNFELNFRNGNTLVLEEGAIDNKGEVSVFKNLKNGNGDKIPLRDLVFPPSEEEGKIVFGSDKIKFEGASSMILSEFKFNRDKGYDKESFVSFSEDGFIVKGVNFDREGYLKRSTSDKETIIAIGNFKEIVHRDSALRFKEAISDGEFNGLSYVEIISKLNQESQIDFSSPFEKIVRVAGFKDTTGNDLELEFDNFGNLKRIREKGSQWLPLTLSLEDGATPLGELYDKSSNFVKDRVINSGHYVGTTYEEIRGRFYLNPFIRAEGNALDIVDVQDNFVVMNGNNLLIGGEFENDEGIISLERGLNSLQGFDASLNVVNGERIFGFREIEGVRQIVKDQREGAYQFPIDKIEVGNSVGEVSIRSWTINEHGNLFSDNGRVMAGRHVITGPYGSSIEISTGMNSEDFKKVVEAGKNQNSFWNPHFAQNIISPSDNMVRTALGSEFVARISTNLPIENVEVDRALVDKYVSNSIDGFIAKLTRKEASSKDKHFGGIVKSVSDQIIPQIAGSKLASMSLEIHNNPIRKNEVYYIGKEALSREISVSGIPSVFVSFGEKRFSIKLTEDSSDLFKDILEGFWRAPDISRGNVFDPKNDQGQRGTTTIYGKPSFFWPPQYLNRISKPITLGQEDKNFRNRIDNKYFKK